MDYTVYDIEKPKDNQYLYLFVALYCLVLGCIISTTLGRLRIRIKRGVEMDGFNTSISFFTSYSATSLNFFAASPEIFHEVEGSQVLAQHNALLHGEDAVETREKKYRHTYYTNYRKL